MNSHEVAIWNQMQDRLMGFVLRYTGDKALAEDIVQDVFLKVHDNLTQLKQSDKISSWIFRIARNAINDHFRRRSRAVTAMDLDWEGEGVTLTDCVTSCLGEMLKTLPEKYRYALELAELEGMSQLKLAEKLDLSYSGAKSRVQRARRILKEKMDAAYHIQFDRYGNAVACQNRLPCGCN